jgi:hypothetical protein
LLTQLCRHICMSRWMGQCLQEVRAGCLAASKPADLEQIDALSKLHAREGLAVQALMVKLRLTTTSQKPHPEVVGKARVETPLVQPWHQ